LAILTFYDDFMILKLRTIVLFLSYSRTSWGKFYESITRVVRWSNL